MNISNHGTTKSSNKNVFLFDKPLKNYYYVFFFFYVIFNSNSINFINFYFNKQLGIRDKNALNIGGLIL